MKSKLIGALLTTILLAPVAASAALLEYRINFGANSTDADGGTGSFYWNDSTELISNIAWDFGGGNTGGINDALVDWSADVFGGGTLSEFLFEILTLQDVHGTGCSTLATGCGQGFDPPQVFGYPGMRIGFNDALNTNAQTYNIGFQGVIGSFSTELVGEVEEIPLPGTMPLLAIAALAWGVTARRTRLA